MYISISTYYILPRVNTPKSQVEKSECRMCKSFELSEFTQMVHVLPVHCNRQLVILRAHTIDLSVWIHGSLPTLNLPVNALVLSLGTSKMGKLSEGAKQGWKW